MSNFKINSIYDYYIFTDGAGYNNLGHGGCHAVVYNTQSAEQHHVSSSCSNTTVYREEFNGLIQGLILLSSKDNRTGLNVAWYSDCKPLVESFIDPTKRNSNKPYWFLIEYFESLYSIEAHYVPRDAGIEFMETADLHASNVSHMMSDYIRSIEPLNKNNDEQDNNI
jgi:ribonuclease HI